MNAAQSKLLAWSAAGALGVALTAYVGWFVSRIRTIELMVTKERMEAVLEDVGEIIQKADNIVPYPRVQAAVIDLDWTGRPPAEAPPVEAQPDVPAPTAVPVADLVKVMFMSFDAEAPAESVCVLKYTPAARVSAPPTGTGALQGWIKRPGDALDAPLEHILVHAIRPDGVEFSFTEEGREHELLAPGEYDLRGVLVLSDESEIVLRPSSIQVPRVFAGEPPPKTTALGDGVFQIGYEDAQYIGENYASILSSEVRPVDHRDPRTGRKDGIQVMDVTPGSVAAQHGLSTGDVVKSINGHPVTSKQEAITFVKNNVDVYDKWEVVVESKGRLKTLVYYSPKK
jgi:hypothetical protein